MSITRIEVEQVLARRLGNFLAEAGMDALQDGVNPWLTDPLRWSLTALGYTVASVTAVTDSDLSGVETAHTEALLDLTELRTLEAVQTNLTAVDVTAGPLSERRSQLADRIGEMVTERRKVYGSRYASLLVAPLSGDAPKLASMAAL